MRAGAHGYVALVRIGEYEIPRVVLVLAALVLVAAAAGVYLLRGDAETASPGTTAVETSPAGETETGTTEALPPAPAGPASTAGPSPSVFQPAKLPGAPPEDMSVDARRVFTRFRPANGPPEGGYWLGPKLGGLRAYLQPKDLDVEDVPLVVYTTEERFPRAEAVYVCTLDADSAFGRELAKSLRRGRQEAPLGDYAVVAPGSIALRTDGQIVQVVVVGAVVRELTASELARAIKR